MGIEWLIVAGIVLLAMVLFTQDRLKAYGIIGCILVGLVLCISTVGCDSFAERRHRRQQERRDFWQERQEKREERKNSDDNHKRRFQFRRFRNDG